MDQTKTHFQKELERLDTEIAENRNLIEASNDKELSTLAEEEIKSLEEQKNTILDTIASIENPGQNKNDIDNDFDTPVNPNVATIEIRAGTGGDEAGLFGADLYRMYQRFAENENFRFEEIFRSDNISGGVKTVSAEIKGKGVFDLLKNESGVHRVQRVPSTESAGRIHTSTATVAVLPQIKATEIEIKPEDLQWDFFRSGGKGGQNVNKVSTAVRLTHIPTGVIVECQEERSQGKNREKALSILQGRLYTAMQEQQVKDVTQIRSSQIGTGDRSEKIRTYNFPQDRITDHRVKKSWGNIQGIMNGNLRKIL